MSAEVLLETGEEKPQETMKMKKISGKEILIERAIQAYIKDFDHNNNRDGSLQPEDGSLLCSSTGGIFHGDIKRHC